MGSPDLLDRLREHDSLGAVTTRKSQLEEWLHIALTGHVAIHVDRGAGTRKIIESRGVDVFGLMPYSRGGAPPGDTVVEEPTETLAIHRELLPVMIRECPGITARLVHAMLDRARHFTSSDLYDEKLVSPGKFAAGLAHELNNPASAAARSTQLLVNGLAGAEKAARSLAAARLSAAQLAAIDGVRIVDDGPGIAREILGLIFDPFFTTKEVGQGIGLGLDIVRRLLIHQAGEIEVESRTGHTVFTVSLTAVDA